MSRKKGLYVVGGALLVAFAYFSLTSFKSSLTPYVSFEQAQTANRLVQVAGALAKGSSAYKDEEKSLYFTLAEKDTHSTLRVRYEGLKPANFEDAISIVAIGHYNQTAGQFEAEKLLVKCPSKYQGAEVKEYS